MQAIEAIYAASDDIDLTDEELARIQDAGDAFQVTLCEPLVFTASKLDGERTLEALTLPKKVKGKHLKAMDKAEGEMGKSMALVAKLAGIPPHACDEMDGRDIVLCLEAVKPFLPRPPRTGRR